MPPLGSAPRLVNGVWVTRKGRKLTTAGQRYWSKQAAQGRFDPQGRRITKPRGPRLEAGKTEQKLGFDTIYKATQGDPAALQQVKRAEKRLQMKKVAEAQADAAVGAQFGGAEQIAARANKVISPVPGAVIESLSPVEIGKSALHHTRSGNVPMAILEAASIFPGFPGFRGAKAIQAAREAKAAQAAAKIAQPLGPEQKVLRETGAARRAYAEQKKLGSAELGQRAAKLGPAFEQAGGGQAGALAARSQLKGELPKVSFNNLTDLDQPAMDQLHNVVHHTDLRPFEKTQLHDALDRVQVGHVPRPFEIKLIERAFGPDRALELAATTPFHREVARLAGEVANLPRSIMATADVSAPFRQGLLAGAANPKIFAKNLAPMFHMLVSEKRFGQVMEEIAERPSYDSMLDARLALTDLGDMATREEQFMSNLAEKIPVAGRIVRGSSRAYVGFLNRMRADLFDHLVADAAFQGIETPRLRRDVARFVNVATGRGELGPLEPAAVVLNATLFSPKLFASRINALNPLWYASLDPFARKQAVLAMAKLIGTGVTVLTLARLAGAQVSLDPRNADFGKLHVGNTRFDIWGGHQQLVRVFSQVASKKIISSTTGETLRLTGGHDQSQRDILLRFFEGKLAPTPSLINDYFKNTNFAGQPFSWKKGVVDRMWPLLIQDVVDIYHGTGSPWKAGGAYGIGAVGIGVQTYGPPKEKGSGGKGGFRGYSDPFSDVGTGTSGGYSDPFGSLSGP